MVSSLRYIQHYEVEENYALYFSWNIDDGSLAAGSVRPRSDP
jgi:hypothetical protein